MSCEFVICIQEVGSTFFDQTAAWLGMTNYINLGEKQVKRTLLQHTRAF
jgi:hypothetical protein